MIQQFFAKLSEKEKKILFVTIFVVLLAFLDRAFFGPAISNLKSLQEDIRDKEDSMKQDLHLIAYKNRILKEKEVLHRYYAKKTLSPGEIKELFLNKIEMLATKSNVMLIKVTPSDGEQKKGFVEYSANLECSGKLKDLVGFMHAIDSSEELLRIIKFNMSVKKASSDEISSTMTVSKLIIDLVPEGNIVNEANPANAVEKDTLASATSDNKQETKNILLNEETRQKKADSPSTMARPEGNEVRP